MAALSMSVFTLEFTNPQVFPNQAETNQVDSSIAFHWPVGADAIQTLSDNGLATGSDVEGLLFVPDLKSGDPCRNISSRYIPQNVTRRSDLPTTPNYLPFVAIAPWISTACTLSYLAAAAAVNDQSGFAIDAFLFYLAKNINSTVTSQAEPPASTDSSWDLGDGGAWKPRNDFPVYGINSDNGNLLMNELGLYSGVMASVPHGQQLIGLYDPRNYVKLYLAVDTGTGSSLPKLWIFLLIVLGLLIAIIGTTSLAMHLMQRRRRADLRNRIISGQVDLESLGIKRLNVPQDIIDKLPLFVYVAGEHNAQENGVTDSPTTKAAQATKPGEHSHSLPQDDGLSPPSSVELSKDRTATSDELSLPSASSLPHKTLPFSQPSCSICLEDFVSHETILRSLPCTHAYHSGCINPLLREYSSLCPICKGRVLPVGFCPPITNLMVRRERGLRRMREIDAQAAARTAGRTANGSGGARPATATAISRVPQFRSFFGRRVANPSRADVELAHVPSSMAEGFSTELSSADGPRPSNVPREEWARHRAEALVGMQVPAEVESRQLEASRPRWRKAVGKLFPVLA